MLYHEVTTSLGTDAPQPDDKARQRQWEIRKVAKEKMQQARDWRPGIGDLVLIRQHNLSKASERFADKLAPRYDGPYKVIKFTSSKAPRTLGAESGADS